MAASIFASVQGSVVTAVVSVVAGSGTTNYCILFGAFAGAVFYVTTAAHMKVFRRAAYFLVSWIVGVYGAGLAGAKLEQILGYSDQPLDGLGAVLLSALAIKTLTFISQQNLGTWLTRWKGGTHGNK